MATRIIIKNGKRYHVNTPDFDVAGCDYGVGSGGTIGTIWMTSTDGKWYAVNAQGTTGSVSLNVSQSALTYQDNSLGYQVLTCDDGNSYDVYFTGTPPAVTFTVSQSKDTSGTTPKPGLLIQSITDGNYYNLTLHKGGSVVAVINQTPLAGAGMLYP